MTTTTTRTLAAVHVVARSGNSKTGPIPVTYRPMGTCEPTCAFLPSSEDGGGCYGTGRIFALAGKYARDVSHDIAAGILARRDRAARFLRDRVVGDVVTSRGTIDHGYIAAVALLARDAALIPFGYTHAWRRMTREDVARIAASGYVLNASCETREDVRAAITLGLPVTIASDNVEDGEIITAPGIDGAPVSRRIVTCPAQTREDTSCASCGLCARPNRAACVRFLIHGTARKRAAASVSRREDGGA